ncbi:MAG: serine/threonine protein kinase, partial [Deltaproteobacteria bacterium]
MPSKSPPTITFERTADALTLTYDDLDADRVEGEPFAPPPLHLPASGPILGTGGMGEVFRAWDPVLRRPVAVKVLHDDSPRRLARFVTEAQITAQLEHPAIVPVHALGHLPDGRLAIAMKEVHGRTLRAVIQERAGRPERLRHVVELLRRAAEAVAHAHARGVVHRDLKPDNIMVGDFGEVLVLDWGLARIEGLREGHDDAPTTTNTDHTVVGAVLGTRGYMSPEQSAGRPVDARTDVYALGVILLEIAIGDHRDWPGELLDTVSGRGLAADQTLKALAQDHALHSELVAIAARALRADPDERHPDAGAFVADLSAWLEGSRRRERALGLVAEAEARFQHQVSRLAAAAALRREAAELLATVPPWKADPAKERGWSMEDRARDLEAEADQAELEALDLLASALNHDPDLAEAHALLATHHRRACEAAEARGDTRAARRHEALVAIHDRGEHAEWLDGSGLLTLVTDPPGATVALFRLVERARRLVPEPIGDLGPTPIDGHRLPRGRYLGRITAPGYAPAVYPVAIGRGEHWDGVPPAGDHPHPIRLLRQDRLPPGTCYVPAGWFLAGDPTAFKSHRPQRVWLDGFLARETCVTVAEYLE